MPMVQRAKTLVRYLTAAGVIPLAPEGQIIAHGWEVTQGR
jgi:hypothetical protein